jgi:hypothetical protein
MERSAPSREVRLLTCGDLSTRSRTLSLKMTCGDDADGVTSPPYFPDNRGIWRSSGGAGFDIVPTMPIRLRHALRTMSYRATLAEDRPGAPLHAAKQAAGVPSVWSQSFNHPPRDPADGATLGSLQSGGHSEGRRPGTPRHATHPFFPACTTSPWTREADFIGSDGQPERPPPQPSHRARTRTRTRTRGEKANAPGSRARPPSRIEIR